MDMVLDARQIERVPSHLARLRHRRDQEALDALESLRPAWLGMGAWERRPEDLEAQCYRERARSVRFNWSVDEATRRHGGDVHRTLPERRSNAAMSGHRSGAPSGHAKPMRAKGIVAASRRLATLHPHAIRRPQPSRAGA